MLHKKYIYSLIDVMYAAVGILKSREAIRHSKFFLGIPCFYHSVTIALHQI